MHACMHAWARCFSQVLCSLAQLITDEVPAFLRRRRILLLLSLCLPVARIPSSYSGSRLHPASLQTTHYIRCGTRPLSGTIRPSQQSHTHSQPAQSESLCSIDLAAKIRAALGCSLVRLRLRQVVRTSIRAFLPVLFPVSHPDCVGSSVHIIVHGAVRCCALPSPTR